ncbi:MAG: 3-dehydroquinate synthase [Rickettsiales bacterium]|nr:3-dehydroquinate synthase [Rickettsiales bacterium]
MSGNVFIEKNIINNIGEYVDFSNFSKIVVLTDENLIKSGWLKKISIGEFIEIKSGEINKNLNTVSYIWEKMNTYKMDRKSLLINLGGGVVCDLGGFCASTYMRGIKFIQIPTTLLSQVDASVGGKTGFDFMGVKNLIGSFTEPYRVLIDSNTLDTLPKREYVSGLAEVIKYGIIYDKQFFDYFENNIDGIDNNYIITKSCEIKEKVVLNDPKEGGIRKILNFGHTIGHSVESCSLKTENPLLHGEAVAIGMVAESLIARELGFINDEEMKKIEKTINMYGLPTKYNGNFEQVYEGIFKDKKNVSGKVKWVLPKTIGNSVFDVDVDENIVKMAIKSILK